GHGRKAIVTICIGDKYLRLWESMAQKNWEEYAACYGYDVVVITDFLDGSEAARARSPAWQKCLILNAPWAQRYERVVWIDADIVIAAGAPDILSAVENPAQIGICRSGDQMSLAERHIYLERIYNTKFPAARTDAAWQLHNDEVFKNAGIVESGVE